ncbi:collagen alpha-1(III) chain-like isoform X13 [Poecile atricapillus]|uniref:collagen alpha-1(III) chain-like isoform X13 n=1 Tax=Poecile atricapillus TaxID=48891 RepID=UPI0027387020|nr:collagen alpha-1(III) chain-like isoform X13 [Poecile atricapillus]
MRGGDNSRRGEGPGSGRCRAPARDHREGSRAPGCGGVGTEPRARQAGGVGRDCDVSGLPGVPGGHGASGPPQDPQEPPQDPRDPRDPPPGGDSGPESGSESSDPRGGQRRGPFPDGPSQSSESEEGM